MANIPIENVPNAPKTGGMGLAGANYRTHGLTGVTRGGVPNFSKAIRSTEPVLHPYLASVAKQEAAAGRNLGGALRQMGGAIGQINERLMQAENVADEARVDNILTAGRQSFAEDTIGADPNALQELWGEHAKGIQEEIDALDLSPMMKERTSTALISYNGNQQASIRADQFRRRNAENTEALSIQGEERFQSGDWEGYVETMETMDANGYMRPGQLDSLLIERRKEFDQNQVLALGYADPKEAIKQFNATDKNGKPVNYPEMDMETRISLNKKLETFNNARVQKVTDRLLDSHIEGKTESFELVDTLVKNEDISYGQGKYLKQQLNRIAPPPLDIDRYLKVRKNITDAKLETDETGLMFLDLSRQLIGFPPDVTSELKNYLNDARSITSGGTGAKSPAFKSGHKMISDKFEKFGEFGNFKTGDTDAPINQKIYEEAGLKQDQAHRFLDDYQRRNPKASVEDVRGAVTDYMKNPREAQGAVDLQFKPSSLPMGSGERTQQVKDLIKRNVIDRAGGFKTSQGSSATTTGYYAGTKSQAQAAGLSYTMEGGVLDAHDNKIIGNSAYEDYAGGRGLGYVTVAMDKGSDWFKNQQYLMSDKHPGVVFKVMDTGSYGNGRDKSWVDIAFSDPSRAKDFKKDGIRFEPITKKQADKAWGEYKEFVKLNLSGSWEDTKGKYFEMPRKREDVTRDLDHLRAGWEQSISFAGNEIGLPQGGGLEDSNALFPQ